MDPHQHISEYWILDDHCPSFDRLNCIPQLTVIHTVLTVKCPRGRNLQLKNFRTRSLHVNYPPAFGQLMLDRDRNSKMTDSGLPSASSVLKCVCPLGIRVQGALALSRSHSERVDSPLGFPAFQGPQGYLCDSLLLSLNILVSHSYPCVHILTKNCSTYRKN